MSKGLSPLSSEAKAAIVSLFETAPPVLVEVRFPGCAASPDWHLLEDEEQLEQVLEHLGAGAELHLSSVWDLKNVKDEICVRK